MDILPPLNKTEGELLTLDDVKAYYKESYEKKVVLFLDEVGEDELNQFNIDHFLEWVNKEESSLFCGGYLGSVLPNNTISFTDMHSDFYLSNSKGEFLRLTKDGKVFIGNNLIWKSDLIKDFFEDV